MRAVAIPPPSPRFGAPRMGVASTSYKPGQSGNPRGRPVGSIGYKDLLTAEDRAKIANAAGCTPLQFLLSVMLDQKHPMDTRIDAAKTAAPYLHRKMPIAVELPGSKPQVDVAKLLALPRAEREQLLTTLTKLGVNLGVGAPEEPGGVPPIVPELGGKMAMWYASNEAKGRPIAPGVAESLARSSKIVKRNLEQTGAVDGTGEAVAPRPKREAPAKKAGRG